MSAESRGPMASSVSKPQFFKIILAQSIQDGKIVIPKKFTRNYGNSLSNPVLLEDPCGAVWPVELSNSNGNVWLENGWRQFSDHYSLERGHFLIFRYEGNSKFSIFIFDRSALEVEYPLRASHGHDEELNCIEAEKRREKPSLPNVRPRKMLRTTTRSKIESRNSVEQFDMPVRRDNHGKQLDKSKGYGVEAMSTALEYLQPKITRRIDKLPVNEKTAAVKKAKAFKSKNPFFILGMQPTYVNKTKQICVPLPFAENYFPTNDGDIVLQVADGRTWSVKYKTYTEKRRCQLSCGWRSFVQDNNLNVYDACVFELIKCSKLSLKVTIYRAAGGANCDVKMAEFKPVRQITPGALESAHSFKSNYPFFKVLMTAGYVDGKKLSVPKGFVRRYVEPSVATLTLQVGKKLWPVTLLHYPDHVCQISGGWSVFARENNLQAGNVCIFEMIKRGPIVLKTSTLR